MITVYRYRKQKRYRYSTQCALHQGSNFKSCPRRFLWGDSYALEKTLIYRTNFINLPYAQSWTASNAVGSNKKPAPDWLTLFSSFLGRPFFLLIPAEPSSFLWLTSSDSLSWLRRPPAAFPGSRTFSSDSGTFCSSSGTFSSGSCTFSSGSGSFSFGTFFSGSGTGTCSFGCGTVSSAGSYTTVKTRITKLF